jgi:rRNA maturation protein Nop10
MEYMPNITNGYVTGADQKLEEAECRSVVEGGPGSREACMAGIARVKEDREKRLASNVIVGKYPNQHKVATVKCTECGGAAPYPSTGTKHKCRGCRRSQWHPDMRKSFWTLNNTCSSCGVRTRKGSFCDSCACGW